MASKNKEISDIDLRVFEWIKVLLDSKIYGSESEFLKDLGFGATKISEARKGKGSFRSLDIRNILMKFPELNADWLMTGRGEMINKSNEGPTSPERFLNIIESQQRVIEKLTQKKDAHPDAGCVDASGLDLVR